MCLVEMSHKPWLREKNGRHGGGLLVEGIESREDVAPGKPLKTGRVADGGRLELLKKVTSTEAPKMVLRSQTNRYCPDSIMTLISFDASHEEVRKKIKFFEKDWVGQGCQSIAER